MKTNPFVLWTDIKTFFPMVWAILRGRYKMPWGTLLWALICAVYVVSPVDAVPDLLPLLGIADDSAFVLFVLTLLHKDLLAFRTSRAEKPKIILEAEVIKTDGKKTH